MIRSALKLLLILLLTATLPLHALAATYYVATTGNDTTGDGSQGNPWASQGKAAGAISAGDTVYIKSGTYTITSSTANISGGRIAPSVQSRWIGYNSTPDDLLGVGGLWSANMPSIKAGVNSINIFTGGADDVSVENIEFDGDKANRSLTAGTSTSGSKRLRAVNCRAKNCAGNGFSNANTQNLWFCEAVSNANNGFQHGGFSFGCIARSNTGDGFHPNGAQGFVGCLAYLNGGAGFTGGFPCHYSACVAYGNSTSGFGVDAANNTLHNCVSYGNTGNGYLTTASRPDVFLFNCAGGGNTVGNFHSTDIPAANQIGFVSLTVDPFVNASGLNFALNSTAGGGALLRSAGLGVFPGSATTGYPDIGVARHQDPSGSSPIIRASRRGLSP